MEKTQLYERLAQWTEKAKHGYPFGITPETEKEISELSKICFELVICNIEALTSFLDLIPEGDFKIALFLELDTMIKTTPNYIARATFQPSSKKPHS